MSRTREASGAVDALIERTKGFGTHARSELATVMGPAVQAGKLGSAAVKGAASENKALQEAMEGFDPTC